MKESIYHRTDYLENNTLEITPRAHAKMSLRGEILSADNVFWKIFGYNSEPENKPNIFDACLDPLHGFDSPEELLSLLSKGNFVILRFRSQTGMRITVQITGFIVKSGNKTFFDGFFKDITRQRELQEQIQYELEFSSMIVENANVIIGVTDAHGKIVDANPKALEIFQYTKDEIIGKNYWELAVPHNVSQRDKREIFFLLKKYGYVEDREIKNIKKDGGELTILWNASALKNEKDEITNIIGMGIDITEKKQLQEQLLQSEKLSAIGQLAAGIAHEVGHPLSSISSLIQLMMEDCTDPDIHRKFKLIERELYRLNRTVQSLVQLSRPTKLIPEIININQVIEEAIRIVKYDRRIKNRRVILHLDPTLPSIQSSFDPMLQVFINLFLNAADALENNPSGGLFVRTTHSDGQVEISVKDEGNGIPEKIRKRIFEPFVSTKTRGKGTGLGLWVCYNIIRTHKGTIEVDSKKGEGTTFTIKLPKSGKLFDE